MTAMSVIQKRANPRREAAALCLLCFSMLVNAALIARIVNLESQRQADAARYQEQIQQAEHDRDRALENMEKMTIQAKQEQLTIATQMVVCDNLSGYRYIGECTITRYCPCEECCGQWADGLTATGIPAGPGIVAADPEVIPLGSTVVIDGQYYLAADTGVTGKWIDICAADHQEAEDFGIQTAEVWVVRS